MKREAAIEFSNDRAAASGARHFVRDTARGWDLDELAEVLALLVSELVTNAVVHADSAGEVRVAELDDGVRVSVADGSTRSPTVPEVDLTSNSGRGLRLVQDLTDAWGIEVLEDGKVVWFELTTAG